ncbi:sulfotransferase family protein, partial [Thermosulfuriphilus sp.]
MLPNFLGIGAQRSATTWLFECLREHPEIFLPSQKEIHFFDENFEKGLQWYESFFKEVSKEKAIGEITPNYYHNPDVLERIKTVLPRVKMLLALRHPLDRAYSAYRLLHEHYKNIPFESALSPDSYLLDLSLYARHISYLYKIFSPSQIHIFFYEDILRDPISVLKGIYRFLNVDESFIPQAISSRYNQVIFPRAQKLMETMGLGFLLSLIKASPFGPLIKSVHARLSSSPKSRPYRNLDP